MSLWDWQLEALAAWQASGCRGIIEAITGAGKTRIALVAIGKVLAMGGCSLVLVPNGELLRQWVKNIQETFARADVRAIGAGKSPSAGAADVIVAVVNSAANRAQDGFFRDWVDHRPSLLVADECHRYAAPTFSLALDPAFDLRMGLTATLARMDGGEDQYLKPYFGDIIYSLGYGRALADGIVTPWNVISIGITLTPREASMYDRHVRERRALAQQFAALSGLDPFESRLFILIAQAAAERNFSLGKSVAISYMYHFAEQRKATAMTEAKYDAFAKVISIIGNDVNSLVFTATKESAERAMEMVIQARLPARIVHSGVTHSDRASAMDDFENDEVRMLLAPRVLDEGIDVPACGTAFILGMGSTARQLKQRLGRIIRASPGKLYANLFYIYVLGTHESLDAEAVHDQWAEVLEHALDVRSYQMDSIVRGSEGAEEIRMIAEHATSS